MENSNIVLEGEMLNGGKKFVLWKKADGQKDEVDGLANILNTLTKQEIKSSDYFYVPASSLAKILAILERNIILNLNGDKFALTAAKSNEIDLKTSNFDDILAKLNELYSNISIEGDYFLHS